MSNAYTTAYGQGASSVGLGNSNFGAFSSQTATSSASYNVAIGVNALANNKYGGSNMALGTGGQYNLLNCNNNVSIGTSALQGPVPGQKGATGSNDNVAIGEKAAQFISSNCISNTLIGAYSGTYMSKNTSYNTIIGANGSFLDASNVSYQYSTGIGYGVVIDASNQIVLGGLNNSVYPTVNIPGTLNCSNITTYNGTLFLNSDLNMNGLNITNVESIGQQNKTSLYIAADLNMSSKSISACYSLSAQNGSFSGNLIMSNTGATFRATASTCNLVSAETTNFYAAGSSPSKGVSITTLNSYGALQLPTLPSDVGANSFPAGSLIFQDGQLFFNYGPNLGWYIIQPDKQQNPT